MGTPLEPVMHAYLATVAYLSDGEQFAIERFTIEVVEGLYPFGIARLRAGQSTYANERIPDLAIAILLVPLDPDDPDPCPPVGPAAHPHCTRAPGAVRVRWDQIWDVGGPCECTACGRGSQACVDIACWVSHREHGHADRFLWALVDLLEAGALARDPQFQQFCLCVHCVMTLEQAAACWLSRDRVVHEEASGVCPQASFR